MKKILWIFIFLLSIVVSNYGQSPLLDSLKLRLVNSPDTMRGSVLKEIIIQTNLINIDSALGYVVKLREFAKATNDSLRLIEAKTFEAEYYWRKSDYKTAMIHAMEVLAMAESSSAFFERRAAIYFTIGNIHLYLLNTDQAIAYYKRALRNFEIQQTKPRQVASILNNIGVVFMDAAESQNNDNLLDSAEVYFKRVLEKRTVANPGTLINAMGNLGQIYLKRKQLQEASRIFIEWERLEAANPSVSAKAMHLGNIGLLQLALDNPSKAIRYLQVGLQAAKEIEARHEEQEYYGNLAKAHAALKDYKTAYDYSLKHLALRDSIFSSEKTQAISELEEKYQTELRQTQIQELEQINLINNLEAQTERQLKYGLIVFLILLTILIIILYNRYQLKQRTAKALDEKNAELQKLNGFKDRMFAVISHDLRNPVNAFSTIIESLHQNLQHASKEELSEFLESTLQSANDLKSLLNNLLEWALVQIEKLPFKKSSVSIHDIVAESTSHIELMAASKKIQIVTTVEPDKRVMVDRAMMTIVIRNLLSNAVKFSPPGSRVELLTQHANGTVNIVVRDQGIGMKEEEVKKLFKIEESTSNIGNSSEKGAGIGLLLCKELIEKNGGKINVQSKLGEGSIFTIELPSAVV